MRAVGACARARGVEADAAEHDRVVEDALLADLDGGAPPDECGPRPKRRGAFTDGPGWATNSSRRLVDIPTQQWSSWASSPGSGWWGGVLGETTELSIAPASGSFLDLVDQAELDISCE